MQQHTGVNTLVIILREIFWVKLICHPISLERFSNYNAFHVTGIDLAGPHYFLTCPALNTQNPHRLPSLLVLLFPLVFLFSSLKPKTYRYVNIG